MKQIFAAAMLIVLAGCQQGNDDNIAIDETNSANAEIETLPPDEGNDQTAEANAVEVSGKAIPAAFHGRWGMTPGDCTSALGDNKGLITIDADSISFYEAEATLTKVTGDYPENFTGTFAFTGEGMNWTNNQNLKLTGSSNTLIRKQSDVLQPFTYKRCA